MTGRNSPVLPEKLKGTQVFIDDTPALTPTELRSRVRKLVREQGDLGMIMVDYLQLMRVAGSGRRANGRDFRDLAEP